MAPRGPGRGRERDRTITQEPEINPNNPVNLMAVLENMDVTMQATTEALGQQINNNGNGRSGAQGLMTLTTFLKVNLPKFKRTTNLTEADTWFQAMETAKELELLQLKQGTMSVSEYTDKFEELFRVSRICQGAPGDFEEWKCIKYEGGLRSDILRSVGPMEIRVFSELVNMSHIVEECVRKAAEAENDRRESHRREHNQGYATRGQEFKRRGYPQYFSQGQNNLAMNENFHGNGKGKQAAAAADVLNCQRCEGHHPNRPCRYGLGLCYNCGKLGHLVKYCPHRKNRGTARSDSHARDNFKLAVEFLTLFISLLRNIRSWCITSIDNCRV
ncbi:uncharacterized protein LOC107493429 [Arachis duranensis]|uniref:Uncharacterized protein LOC107493429 n=1 Tax=Arachis duranensis TaxID=130453 RepID=A0A6P4DKY4_ARADU|nr:uncharacterized protein LOC107493429 [Arachis duranensis]